MTFGSYLRQLREEKELSLRELARRAEVSVSYLSHVESGKREPPAPAILKRVASALEVTTRELMAKAGHLQEGVVLETEKDAIEQAVEFLLHHPRLRDKTYFKKLPLRAQKALIELYEALTGQPLLYPPRLLEAALEKLRQQPQDQEAWGESDWPPITEVTIPGQGTVTLQDKLLDLSQAVEYLGTTEAHTKKLAQQGQLPYVAKIDEGFVFSERALAAWVQGRGDAKRK